MSPRRLDLPALVAGIVVLGLGVLLLLDRVDALSIGFGELAPVFLGACGAVLLATGLDNRDRERTGGAPGS